MFYIVLVTLILTESTITSRRYLFLNYDLIGGEIIQDLSIQTLLL